MLNYLPLIVLGGIGAFAAGIAWVLVQSLRYHAWELADDHQGDIALRLPPLHPRQALPRGRVVVKARAENTGKLLVLKSRLGQLMPSHVSNQPPEAA